MDMKTVRYRQAFRHFVPKAVTVFLAGLWLGMLPLGTLEASDCRIVQAKSFTFRVAARHGQKLTARTRFLLLKKNGTVFWHYRHNRGEVCWNVTTDRMAKPLVVSYSDGLDFMHLDFRSREGMTIRGTWDGQAIERTASLPENLTAEICMPARMVCREDKETYTFKLLRSESFPELKTYEMRLKIVGTEVVRVPAGTFQCTKVKLSPVSPMLQPFYQGTLYISRDEYRYIVRMDNVPKGFDYVLETIRDLPAQGQRTDCVPEPSAGWEQPEPCL